MLDNLTSADGIRQLSQTNPALACEKARELVATDPNNEQAAVLLRDVVAGFVETQGPRETLATDLVEAAPDVREAARLLEAGEEEPAEILLRKHLSIHRNDPPAMRLMAEIAARCGFFENAERIARRALEIDPKSIGIRLVLARILFFHLGDVEANREGELALEI